MKRLLLIVVCGLLAVLSTASAQVPDKTKELAQKIEPSLQVIEKQLDEIEADFWKNVRELDTGSQNFLSTNPLYQSFNQKIVDFVSHCRVLQRVLYDSDVDTSQYPVAKRAIGILSVWKRLPQLHARIMGRRNPATRKGMIALGADCINSILMTSEIHPSLPEYAALLDDMAIVNMELFYITQCGPHTHIGSCHSPFEYKNPYHQLIQKYCKLMSEDLLITSAGEFFMAVRDLRKIIHGLRTRPYPEPIANNYKELDNSQVLQETDNKYFYAILRHIEDDLNQIEREFWDTIYKGGDTAVSNKNLSRYGDFQRLLSCLQVDCRNFQAMLRKKKIDSGEYNPTTDGIIIYNLGRHRDQELRRQMRRFFNRNNLLELGSKKKRVELVYHFRAYDVNQETIPPKARSYIPYADLKVLNIPERLDEFCASNIALFKSDEREFKVLGDSAEQYFNAVKGLRRTIEHWKNKFEPRSPQLQQSPVDVPSDIPAPPSPVDVPSDIPATPSSPVTVHDESELHAQVEPNVNTLLPPPSKLREILDLKDGYYLLTSSPQSGKRPQSSRRLITKKLYEPPFTITAEVMAESTNIRFLFGNGEIIFNWEVDQNEFRCDIPSAYGQHAPGKGYIPIHQWVSFKIEVTHSEAKIYVDGSQRLTLKGKFERAPVGIYTRLGGVLRIKRFQIESGSDEQTNSQATKPVLRPPRRVKDSESKEEKIEIPEVGSEELFQLAINKIKQKRFKEAQAYLLHLAEKDFVPAQYLISFISDNNIEIWNRFGGSGKSEEKWLKKAAEAGYVPAVERWIKEHNLQSSAEQEEALHFADRTQAIWRLTGKLADMSVDKRDQWLDNIRKQAAEGNAACQLLLSYCYAADNIIDHSPAKAKEWLQKAVDQEYPEALLWVWGWRPWGEWAATDEKWKDKAIAKGGIPPIADLVLGGSDLPESTLAKLEDAGKRGDEMAMCALLSYYSKRKNQYPKQFEQWKKELKQYRSFQELINYPFLRNWGWSQRLLLNAASKALGEKGSSDAPFGGQPFGGGPFGG